MDEPLKNQLVCDLYSLCLKQYTSYEKRHIFGSPFYRCNAANNCYSHFNSNQAFRVLTDRHHPNIFIPPGCQSCVTVLSDITFAGSYGEVQVLFIIQE